MKCQQPRKMMLISIDEISKQVFPVTLAWFGLETSVCFTHTHTKYLLWQSCQLILTSQIWLNVFHTILSSSLENFQSFYKFFRTLMISCKRKRRKKVINVLMYLCIHKERIIYICIYVYIYFQHVTHMDIISLFAFISLFK